MNKLNEELKREIIEYYQSNPTITLKEIEDKYHISKSTLYHWLKRYNISLKGLRYRPRIHNVNINCFDIDSPEKFYWLGFLGADGYINEVQNTITIQLKEEDANHLQSFLDFCSSDSEIKYYTNNLGVKTAKAIVCSKEIVQKLKRYNLYQNKSETYLIPIDEIPEQYMSHFLRRLFDGDGCITFTQRGQPTFAFCSGNYACCEQVKNLLKLPNKVCRASGVWKIAVTGINKAVKIFDYLYLNSAENMRLARKYLKYKSIQKIHDDYFNSQTLK